MRLGISIAISSRKNHRCFEGIAYDSLFLTIESPDDGMYCLGDISVKCSLGIPGFIELTDPQNIYQTGHQASCLLDFYTPVRGG